MKVGTPSHWAARLLKVIQTTEPIGSFAHHKMLTDMPRMMPHVTVHGVGRLGFPMPDVVVDALIATSTNAQTERVPFIGNADKSNTWQIDAAKIAIDSGNVWSTYLSELVLKHCFELGISSDRFAALGPTVHLESMRIYNEGGYGLDPSESQTDVTKFGTLLVQLPTSSGFTGGELTLSNNGATKCFDLSIESANEFHSVAFYSDCECQLLPILSGKRVCLVYKLTAASVLPSFKDKLETEHELERICNDWKNYKKCKVTKIGHQLVNEYTNEDISRLALVNRDEIVFSSLYNAKSKSGTPLFHVSLLLMENRLGWSSPLKLIKKNNDGSIQEECIRDDNEDEWDMRSYDYEGWWVFYNERLGIYSEHYLMENESNNEYEYEDEYEGDNINMNRQMFWTPCSVDSDGVDDNDINTKKATLYACAIIISPFL